MLSSGDNFFKANSTIFFITVNSNKLTNSTRFLTFDVTESGVSNFDILFGSGLIEHPSGNPDRLITRHFLNGAVEIGPLMERLHVHLIVGIQHETTNEMFSINLQMVKDYFMSLWDIDSVYVNIRATRGSKVTADSMTNYLIKKLP